MASEIDRLAPREREVLELLLVLGTATAVEVQAGLESAVSNSTVRKMLTRLHEKGLVSFKMDGARFVYRATVARRKASRSALAKLIHVFFDGSAGKAALAALEEPDTRLTDAELDELEELIRHARKRS